MAPCVGTVILSTLALLSYGAVAEVAGPKPLMRTAWASSTQMHIMSGGDEVPTAGEETAAGVPQKSYMLCCLKRENM